LSAFSGLSFVVRRLVFLGPFFSDPLSHNGLLGVVASAITNLTVFGQDWIVFLKQGAGEPVTVVRNLNETTFHLYRYLIIPQAWSVALELYFYALAPFLCRLKTKHLIALVLMCVACRLVAVHAFGLGRDPWTYRFFPFEIALFAYGMLAYRLYQYLGRAPSVDINLNRPSKYAAFGGGLLAFLWLHRQASNWLGSLFGTENVLCLVMLTWVPLLGFLFRLLEKHPVDRFVGELSYPIYLVHLAVFAFQALLAKKFSMEGFPLGVSTAVVSIGLAFLLNVTVLGGLERWRQRRIIVLNQAAA
jgi:peptidoglycan/LPS O-acetylase OafA/YrhL